MCISLDSEKEKCKVKVKKEKVKSKKRVIWEMMTADPQRKGDSAMCISWQSALGIVLDAGSLLLPANGNLLQADHG